MKIQISDTTIELKYSFRAYMIYEQITDGSFTPKGMKEIITFFYSVVMGSNKNLTITLDDFIDWLDSNPEMINNFSTWLADNINRQNELAPKEEKNIKEVKGDNSKNS